MTQRDFAFRPEGPSRVLGPQRVRRRIALLLSREASRRTKFLKQLRALHILNDRCLRLRDLPPEQAAWCSDVRAILGVMIGLAGEVPPNTRWLCDVLDRMERLAERAGEVLPVDRDPRPARKQRKRP